MLIGPRAAVAFLIVLAILPYLSVPPAQIAKVSRRPPPLIVVLAVFAAYVLASAAWSQAPKLALYTVAIGSLVLAASWAAVAGMALMPLIRCRKLANAIIIGFAIGLAFLLIEELSDDAIKLFFYNKLPFVIRNPKHMNLRDAEILNVALYMSNRSVAIASLLLWPVLGMIAALFTTSVQKPWRMALSLSIGITVVVIVLLSQHETSAIALSLGAVVFLVAFVSRRGAVLLATAGWLTAVLLVIPAAHYAYDGLQLQKPGALPFSARARVVLWKYTATQIRKAPYIGVGALSTEPLDVRRGPIEPPPDEPMALRSGRHAHNIYLQVWYELGGIGAAMLLAIGVVAIASMRRLAPEAQPFALATFAGAAAMAATSWSLWQEWFMASFGVIAVCCWLVHRIHTDPGRVPFRRPPIPIS
jgi:O-antigen ligase